MRLATIEQSCRDALKAQVESGLLGEVAESEHT